jgi:WD40 repeat protein/class 3 adenylate cyclase
MDHSPSTPIPFTDLPEGTVTFLFTDIEGSTRLLEQLREGYATLLADQRRILRGAFADWQGREVDTQGDAFFVAFSRATQAVCAAAQAQRALAEHPWPEGVSVRVRMGIHTGEPWSGEEGYVGMDVHRAARIAHVGHGGQVLLSETTTALVQDELPEGVSLFDLGRHLLKDIHRPERICQLVIEGLLSEFPALTSLELLPPESARPPRQVGGCPYRGLAAFQEADAPFYFGREAFVDALEQAVRTRKLVAVIVGSSGSGKSSALFAGLLPRLREAGGYQFASFRPGTQPFYALAGALLPLLEPGLSETERLVETGKLAEPLSKAEVHLSQVIERILEKNKGTRQVLLIADQFEELYTLCPDERLHAAFVDELLRAVEASRNSRDGSAVILLTLRADFMGQALAHRPFADALQEASLMLGPMTRQELRTAIEQPAEMQGAAFEAGLVERILDDVGEKPGNLPLLEFTLTQLWEQQTDGWLAHADYEAMGCVEGALAAYADQVFADLDAEGQEQARHALVQLVQPGEGTEDTRRIATKEELGEESWSLIQRLADKRLVVTGRDAQGRETAEVVHEALIQKWGRFQEWMEADRSFRAWQERLRSNLRQWQESGRDEGALLAGAPLAVAEGWLAERAAELSQGEVSYIQESQVLQERRQAEREQQQVEREHRRRLTIIGLAAGLLITLILSMIAFQQRQEAMTQRENSMRQSALLLAGQAEVELADGYHDRAVLLALAAIEDYPYTSQAEHALGQAVSYNRALQQYKSHTSAVTSVAWSPDGAKVASSSSSENRVDIWDPNTGETLLSIEMPKGITGNIVDMALHVQWTPDGRRLLTLNGDRYSTGSQDYDLLLWDTLTGELISSVEIANQAEPESGELAGSFLNYPTGAVAQIAPRNRRLATLGGDNTALVWDSSWQIPEISLNSHTQGINSVNWSPDENKLATASLDGTAIIWDALSGKTLHILVGHEGRVNLALWSPDGASLATTGEDGTIRLWNTENGDLLRSIETNAGFVSSLAWAPNGVRLISGHSDGGLRIWETFSGKLLETLRGHQGMISDLKWSPEGNRLASADNSGTVRVWNAEPSTAWRLYPPQAKRGGDWTAQGASWSSDGRYLAIAGGDLFGDVTEPPSFAIWDVQNNHLMMENLGDSLRLNGRDAYFSPDDRAILYVGLGTFPDFSPFATAYVFDVRSGEIVRTFTPDGETLTRSVAWSPDGSQVATGMFFTGPLANQIIVWDYYTGEQITRLVHSEIQNAGINWVEWSPDGSKFASASDDSTARVWDAHTWAPIHTLQHEPPTMVFGLAWSPDGSRLLTTAGNDEQGAKDHTARVWDGATGKELLVFHGHSKTACTGDWSPDGQRIATFGAEGIVKIWDATTGTELLTLPVPVLAWGLTQWSPDGRHLAIVGVETLISIWRVWQTTQELIDYAKECCVFRELTDAERVQFGLK